MELSAIEKSYARWAPVYDATFGRITQGGRQRAVGHINARGGDVLEVGVGTGLALGHYGPGCRVIGLDYSEDMLAQARARVLEQGLSRVKDLVQMDARNLEFPDGSFDFVAAMHVLSVVPEPERVMAEIARVLRPGGEVVITNHFARRSGTLATVERLLAPLQDRLGWHADFDRRRVLGAPSLKLVAEEPLPPFGLMTFLLLRKAA